MTDHYLPDDVARCETQGLCPLRMSCLRYIAPVRDVRLVVIDEFGPDDRGYCDDYIQRGTDGER